MEGRPAECYAIVVCVYSQSNRLRFTAAALLAIFSLPFVHSIVMSFGVLSTPGAIQCALNKFMHYQLMAEQPSNLLGRCQWMEIVAIRVRKKILAALYVVVRVNL